MEQGVCGRAGYRCSLFLKSWILQSQREIYMRDYEIGTLVNAQGKTNIANRKHGLNHAAN